MENKNSKIEMPKVADAEVAKLQKTISGSLTGEQKDLLLAELYVSLERVVEILKSLIETDQLSVTKAQKKEIEEIVSFGPPWFRYTRKSKKKK